MVLQQALQALDEVAVEKLLRRDVDRDARARPQAALPERSCFDRTAQRPIADIGDQAGLLCDLEEVRRRDDVAVRLAPAQQRLDRVRLERFETDFRLIQQLELTPLHGTAQGLLDL